MLRISPPIVSSLVSKPTLQHTFLPQCSFDAGETPPLGPTRSFERHHQRRQRRHDRRPDPVSASAEEALARRRHVYTNGLLVKRVGSNRYSRFIEISPEVFRSNSQRLSRLIPWLRRELQAILDDDNVELVREYVMALLKTYDPQSQEAVDRLCPFLHARTEHFLHELVAFARSPFDMATYDRRAQYDDMEPPAHYRPQAIRNRGHRNLDLSPPIAAGHALQTNCDGAPHHSRLLRVPSRLPLISASTLQASRPAAPLPDNVDEAGPSSVPAARPASRMQEALREKMQREMEVYEGTRGGLAGDN
ncbi:hypothetical protein BC936DRAFT_147586 [Jimgerdemannia flammicorona]|uniref:RING-type E3 ubiquitin transferase n=1 Tax=Jimgerdemannia flammicorona TaxID=994334 RepID=A0A433D505_9FUNG|nr:hypothetical protein BC936DRAFT_147586 [Jimgerdemannia flammicorona]